MTELPSRIDSLRIWPNDLRLSSLFSLLLRRGGRSRRTRGFRGTRRRLLAHELSPAPACSASGVPASGFQGFPASGAPGASDPGHQQAEFLHRHRGRPEAGDPALVHDRDPVRERVDLVQFGRDDEHGHAVVALLHDAAVHELDRAHVQAPGRLAGHQHLVLPAEFPGQDDLLLVAAGQRAHRRVRRLGADVELLHPFGRVAGDGAQVQVDARGERRPVVAVQDHVVGHREGADQPVFLPVLGDVGDPRVQPLPGRAVGEVAAVQPDVPGGDRPQPEQRLAQLGLPVALHARQAEDLARADLERHPVHPDPAGLVRDRQVLDVEHHVAGLGRVLADRQLHVPADHHRGELVLAGGRRLLADDRAAAQHGDRVRDRLDFLELVRDEDDGRPGVLELPDDAEQVVGLGRGEHRGRLVEDQHGGVPDQRLDDLDPLLDADRQVLHQRVRVDREPVALGQLAHVAAGLAPVEQAGRAGFLHAEGDVLRDREHGHEHEVLVHHSDAGRDGVLGRMELDALPVEQDLALVRLQQPVQDVHQGRLAGAVLAEQGVHLAR